MPRSYWKKRGILRLTELFDSLVLMNRRMPNGTYGGVVGGARERPSYPIGTSLLCSGSGSCRRRAFFG